MTRQIQIVKGADIFFRSHNFADLCGSVTKSELTQKQKTDLDSFLCKSLTGGLTDKMREEMNRLIAKRDSKPELDATGKALVEQIFREVIRGTYTHKVETYVLQKGIERENHAIARVAKVNGWGLCMKYDGPEGKDKIGTGRPDILKPKIHLGADTKCSFTDKTFPMFKTELPEKKYIIQAKRYATIFELPDWNVCYSLENSSDETVLNHARKLWREAGCEGWPTEDFIDDVRGLHNFDHLADWERVKTFNVPLLNEDVIFHEKRAQMGRDYFDELMERYLSMDPAARLIIKIDSEKQKYSCDGKVKHIAMTTAEIAAQETKPKRGHYMEVYKCEFCDHFHVGNKSLKP